jgi:predicted phage-related endonuclease
MDLVRRGVPPAPDESQSTANTLQALYPEDNGQIIELPTSAVEWDRELQQIKEQLKELTSKRDRIENALKETLKRGLCRNRSGRLRHLHLQKYLEEKVCGRRPLLPPTTPATRDG